MIVVGELINASRKAIGAAIEAQDKVALEKVAKDQADAGATFIDVNAGVFVNKEAEYLAWLVKLVQGTVEIPCCLDSPDPAALEAALAVHRRQKRQAHDQLHLPGEGALGTASCR